MIRRVTQESGSPGKCHVRGIIPGLFRISASGVKRTGTEICTLNIEIGKL